MLFHDINIVDWKKMRYIIYLSVPDDVYESFSSDDDPEVVSGVDSLGINFFNLPLTNMVIL